MKCIKKIPKCTYNTYIAEKREKGIDINSNLLHNLNGFSNVKIEKRNE